MIIGLIISITLAVTFLILYVANVQDYASLKKDNEWQNRQLDGLKRDNALLQKRLEEAQASAQSQLQPASVSITSSDYDSRPLNKETAMEAIRYNGYVPDANEAWIDFMVQGEHFAIDAERFPIMLMIKHCSTVCGNTIKTRRHIKSLMSCVWVRSCLQVMMKMALLSSLPP